MKYSVVGSTGMLGKRVIKELHDRGEEAISIPNTRFGKRIFNSLAFSGIDVIINCAGSISLKEPTPVEMIEANAIGPWQ